MVVVPWAWVSFAACCVTAPARPPTRCCFAPTNAAGPLLLTDLARAATNAALLLPPDLQRAAESHGRQAHEWQLPVDAATLIPFRLQAYTRSCRTQGAEQATPPLLLPGTKAAYRAGKLTTLVLLLLLPLRPLQRVL